MARAVDHDPRRPARGGGRDPHLGGARRLARKAARRHRVEGQRLVGLSPDRDVHPDQRRAQPDHGAVLEALIGFMTFDTAPRPIPEGAPPLAPVCELIEQLERAGVTCALGGSGLLAALGLADHVRDWDFTTDATVEQVIAASAGRAYRHVGSDALHADQKLMFGPLGAEIIVGFSFFVEGGVVHIPTHTFGWWNGVRLGSPECWAVAYELMERPAKVDALLEWLDDHGADLAVVEELLRQPLPPALAARLRSLPRRTR